MEKSSSQTPLDDIRLILPLPSLLAVIDAIVAALLTDYISESTPQFYPEFDCCFFGSMPGTQCLDVAWAVHHAIEKMLDCHSQGAVASADIRQYYDHLPPLKAARHFCERGVPSALAATFLRIHTCAKVNVNVMGGNQLLRSRAIGCLTGSRSAVVAGRLPTEDAAAQCRIDIERSAFKFGDFRFGLLAWVDNLFMIGASPTCATGALEKLEEVLSSQWGLNYKGASRSVLVPKGCWQERPNSAIWPEAPDLQTIGHLVSHDGGIRFDFDQCVEKMWGAYWACASSNALRNANWKTHMVALNKFVVPVGTWRWSRLPLRTLPS